MIKESLRQNHGKFLIYYGTELTMDCLSPFTDSFKKFKGKRSLAEFIQKRKSYVIPTQINIDFDPLFQKQQAILYVPLLATLDKMLHYEDVLSSENDYYIL